MTENNAPVESSRRKFKLEDKGIIKRANQKF